MDKQFHEILIILDLFIITFRLKILSILIVEKLLLL